MPKIKCPHCGATNQDVTETERCWQCNTVLSAQDLPVSEATAPTLDSSPKTGAEKLAERPAISQTLVDAVPPAIAPLQKAEEEPIGGQKKRNTTVLVIGVIITLVLIIAILLQLKKS